MTKRVQDKTLEQLENEVGEDPGYISNLVTRVHELRKKPLKDFTIEDLRIVIGQSFSLDYLIPVAIEKLQENILAEGDYYEGDLLKNVLDSDSNYWKNHKENWLILKDLFEKNKPQLESAYAYKRLKKSFEQFETINK